MRRTVTLEWLDLAYCTFVSEKQEIYLNCGVVVLKEVKHSL